MSLVKSREAEGLVWVPSLSHWQNTALQTLARTTVRPFLTWGCSCSEDHVGASRGCGTVRRRPHGEQDSSGTCCCSYRGCQSTSTRACRGYSEKLTKHYGASTVFIFGGEGGGYRETFTFIEGFLGLFYIEYLLLLTSEIQHRSPLRVFYSNLFSAVNPLHTKAS